MEPVLPWMLEPVATLALPLSPLWPASDDDKDKVPLLPLVL
jgi:hypothetical protein